MDVKLYPTEDIERLVAGRYPETPNGGDGFIKKVKAFIVQHALHQDQEIDGKYLDHEVYLTVVSVRETKNSGKINQDAFLRELAEILGVKSGSPKLVETHDGKFPGKVRRFEGYWVREPTYLWNHKGQVAVLRIKFVPPE